MQKIKPYINYIIAIVVILVILFTPRNCKSGTDTITVVTDTIWRKADTVFIKKLVPYTVIKTVPTKEFLPSKDCDTLKLQYTDLVDHYVAKVVYKDSTDIKGHVKGKIYVTDTVQFNRISSRKWEFNLEIPEVKTTTTITKQEEPKRQLYIGANLFGNQNALNSFTPGFIYKTKKDNIYQVNVGIDFTGNISYGIGTYYKIKLRK